MNEVLTLATLKAQRRRAVQLLHLRFAALQADGRVMARAWNATPCLAIVASDKPSRLRGQNQHVGTRVMMDTVSVSDITWFPHVGLVKTNFFYLVFGCWFPNMATGG